MTAWKDTEKWLRKELCTRLRPFGFYFDVQVNGATRDVTITANLSVTTPGHYWRDNVIAFSMLIDERELAMSRNVTATLEASIDAFCKDTLLSTYERLMAIPRAAEQDYRPDEAIPEDFYAM